jgi:hypothetical protein
VVGNQKVIHITEACDLSPDPPAAPFQFVSAVSEEETVAARMAWRGASGTIEAALVFTHKKEDRVRLQKEEAFW